MGNKELTKTERYNNPGAIRPGKIIYEGQVDVDADGFAIFETPEAGRRALINQINTQIKRGENTVDTFLNRYAPPGKENPPASRDNYRVFLAEQLGLSSTSDPFPEGSTERIADAITKFEGGTWGKPPTEPSESSTETEEAGKPAPTLKDKFGQLFDDAKKLAVQTAEEYPTGVRAGLDVAGALIGRKAGQSLEAGQTSFERSARRYDIQQRAAERAAAQASAQAAAPGATPGTPAPEGGTPGEKWARKVVGEQFIKPGVQSSTEAARDFRRAIPSGKLAGKLPTMFNMPHLPPEGQPMSIVDRLIAQRQAVEQAAIEAQQAAANQPQPRQPSPLSRGAQATSRGVNIGYRAFPGAAGALAGLGAAELGQQAYSRFSEGDVPGGILASVGAGSSALSLFPFPVTRVPSTLLAVASPLALLAYDKMKERAVSQAEGYGALMGGATLPTPTRYSGYTAP